MPAKDEASKLKIYVSYSDADIEFVDKLVEGLERDGNFELSITPDPSANKRNWKSRTGGPIANADTILFVLSPDSAQSEVFEWEAGCAYDQSKRIIPILYRPLGAVAAPVQLAAYKSWHFDNKASFDNRLRSLVNAIDANTDWLRMHTQLATRAREWDDSDRSTGLLLTGAEIIAAKRWTFERPNNVPKPTELHMMYIEASELTQTARRDGTLKPQMDLAEVAKFPALTMEKKRARRKPAATETSRETELLVQQTEAKKQTAQLQAEDNQVQAKPIENETALSNGFIDEQEDPVEQTLPVQFQAEKNRSRRRQGPLQLVLGSVLLGLAAAGVWQALEATKPAPDTNRQAMVHSRLSQEPTERLFVVPSKRIEDALTKVDCLLLQGQEEIDACIGRNE